MIAILIKTCQAFRARRQACETTWAGDLRRRGVPVYYAEGGHRLGLLRGNVIELPGGDAYRDNSFKVRDALAVLLAAEPQASHVFVCDDNTFVHPGRWMAFQPASELVGLCAPPAIPWIHGGAGWYMSRRACQLYIAGIARRCSWDDTLAWEILTGRHGIPIENHPDLFAQWTERVAADNQLITCHNVEPAEMPQLYGVALSTEGS